MKHIGDLIFAEPDAAVATAAFTQKPYYQIPNLVPFLFCKRLHLKRFRVGKDQCGRLLLCRTILKSLPLEAFRRVISEAKHD
ncbi:hypothetical protein [Hahella sp. NBU794]|uniref:hypothetical protein n=1 Tax=Hahella sp. NBU794 TaxID=3422590 RepID=UPI003D70170C